MSQISNFEIIQRLRLIRSENVGPKTFKQLLSLYESADMALSMLTDLALNGGAKRQIKICSSEVAENELSNLNDFNAELMFWDDISYPKILSLIDDYPPILTVKGNTTLLNSQNLVGIVGARSASLNGIHIANKIATDLSNQSIIIVSGLARGIDSVVHTSSLKSGTIAVIAGGINTIYPIENRNLYNQIFASGLVITEYAYDALPVAHNFPRRNRIISGLSHALIIIEASLKSGSLITASYAKKHNRKIFAIPGSPLDSKYSGNNWLIKNGNANLLTSAEDVIEFFKIKENYSFTDHNQTVIKISNQIPSDKDLSKFRNILHNAIGFSPTSVEDIIMSTFIPYYILNVLLLEMELAGTIERTYGNKITRVAS